MRYPHASSPQHRPSRPPRRRGFTMIELMIVLMILSFLVAMVVGIGNYVAEEQYRKQTREYQGIIMAAIQRFTQITGGAPGDSGMTASDRIRTLATDLAGEPAHCPGTIRPRRSPHSAASQRGPAGIPRTPIDRHGGRLAEPGPGHRLD